MKKITGLSITQEAKEFKNEKGELIDYNEYLLHIDGRDVKIKPANAVSKVRMIDAFEKVAPVAK